MLRCGDQPSSQQQQLYLTVLQSLPSEQLLFYVKSFQSLVFNVVLQWRVRRFRSQVLAGDLFRRGDEEIAVGSLDDVVLPLCGYDVKLPSNEVGSFYDRVLEEWLGWRMEDFERETSPVGL